MTHLFIVNPAAGKHDRTELVRREAARVCGARGLSYQVEVSQCPGDCRRIAREAALSGESLRLYACGGDGTLNEVVSGIVGFPNVSVTHYAGGSGNDFVKIFGAVEPFQDLERLLDCQETDFDLIRCNDSYAINVCSVGFDARIGTEVARYKRLPLVSGSMAYLLSAVANLVKGVTEHYVVQIDGRTYDGRQTMICVCSGRYYGGGFNPVPEADPTDGLLDVLLVGPVSRRKVLDVIGIYKAGRYREIPELVRHIRTDRVKVLCDGPTSINLDGELRRACEAEFSVAGEKVRFFYPRGLTFAPAESGCRTDREAQTCPAGGQAPKR